MMDVAFKHAQDVYAELSGKNANWKKVYEDYAKFRADQNWWFRFGEARFDGFMQSQKL
jgi:TRAP-type mannitol/chloroaromatic compound transport system substrate-binding protein